MGWEQLQLIFDEAKEEVIRQREYDADPEACPHDGTPLVDGHCPFDGWTAK